MTRETWFLAVENKHSGQRRAFLITDQLNEAQVQAVVDALARRFPTERFLTKRESELDAADVLLWRKQCREAEALQRHAPLTRPARMSEPLWKREIRTIRATAEEMIADMVAPAGAAIEDAAGSSADSHAGETRPTAASDGTGSTDANEDFQSGQWFVLNTKIPTARLRQAARPKRKTKRVRKRTIDGVVCYLLSDAQRWWSKDMTKP